MVVIVIYFICVAIAFWFFTRPPRGARRSRMFDRVRRQQKYPYRAVSISHRDCACSAVKVFDHQPILVENVPPLPLPECESTHCECHYIRHEDRRCAPERRHLHKFEADLYAEEGACDRRTAECRRKEDTIAAAAAVPDYGYIEYTGVMP